MDNLWAYIANNPVGAGLVCALVAFVIATLSALVAALTGGAGRIFGEYQALGRSLSDSQRAQQTQSAAYAELRARVAELQTPPPAEPTAEPGQTPTDDGV